MRERASKLQQRAASVRALAGVVLSDVPGDLPEIQQLRMRLSQARALFLVLETTLQSLREREEPRSTRMANPDPDAYLGHLESLGLVNLSLKLIGKAKDVL